MDCGSTILIFFALIQATCGQSVTLTGPPAIEQGSDTVYICTGGAAPYTFIWEDLSVGTGVNIFIAGEAVYDPVTSQKYVNFDVSENGGTSTMTIYNTQIEDEGQYRCTEGQGNNDDAELTVEVKGTWSVSPEGLVKSNINDMFEAMCEAVGGRPNETITWMLGDGPSPCDDTVVTYPDAGEGLFSTTSICKFQATSEKNGKTLKCVISGHELSNLNGEVTTALEMHNSPDDAGTTVTVNYAIQGTGIRVSCSVQNQPTPAMRNYYIFSNDTLIHESMESGNAVSVSDPIEGTNYTCIAGNYLGNTTLSEAVTYDPSRPTTPSPTTAQATVPPVIAPSPGDRTGPAGLSAGAYAGIAIGVIACIVIIVVIVLYLLKPECCPCFGGSGPKSTGSSKPARSAVGSSNGSEKEKTRPQAAPRGHGSIQHTNDNPNQDMYAMVDKKKPGGDAPDRGSGPGQNEPQGMLYADLDLSHQAGHTEKHVPKNENDVVVYSSILV